MIPSRLVRNPPTSTTDIDSTLVLEFNMNCSIMHTTTRPLMLSDHTSNTTTELRKKQSEQPWARKKSSPFAPGCTPE